MSAYFFVGGYYIDRDEYGQLRIAGPGNHLFCGWTLPDGYTITHVRKDKQTLKLTVNLKQNTLTTPLPVMGDVRSIRSVTEVTETARPTFQELQTLYHGRFMPTEINIEKNTITLIRKFSQYTYGLEIKAPKAAQITQIGDLIQIIGRKNISIKITCFYTFPGARFAVRQLIKNGLLNNAKELLPSELKTLTERSEEEIEHLIGYGKTSSFEYGTIFPRDWMESAELGKGDLTHRTIEEMYAQALKNVDEQGIGWHEDVVGELAEKFQTEGKPLIDRSMIDIEPRYMIGLSNLSAEYISQNRNKLKSIAEYTIKTASDCDLIYFKNPHAGNWRDSQRAFLNVQPPIAPFDVNAVLYQAALRQIRNHQHQLQLENTSLDPLITKWKSVQEKYRFTDPHGHTGFALCLYGEENKPLQIHHTDEAYLLLYGQPTQDDCISFASRVVDPEYFYTPGGTLLVGKGQGYTTNQYHGEVIWPKQTALVVAGLRTQIDRAVRKGWDNKTIKLLIHSLIVTTKASNRAFIELDSTPELYYYTNNITKRYDSQRVREGQVSYIQLWSSIGFRRILRDYIYICLKYDYPLEFF